ncbi:DUF4249 domain-containing protein [Bacteroides sp. OttesenSCG-928-D19]|nr:DUF4249 domain-containing protein [Bacteroides sp. OttesenSCG-928-N06]MDL2303722.1 DUF4249 domain-containing protein [Bacteroides sp. OttesenSCG-928-D19]
MKKITIYILLLAYITSGCVSEFNAKLPDIESDILVVEGSIIGNSTVEFYLSKTFPMNDEVDVKDNYIEADLVIISDDGYRSPSARYEGFGVHTISIGELKDNVSYGIEIEYEGKIFRSKLAYPIQTPEIEKVDWIQPEQKGDISIRVSTSGTNNEQKEYFYWTYEEDWEVTSYYEATYFYNPVDSTYHKDGSGPYYYCWKKAVNQNILIGSTNYLQDNKLVNHPISILPASNERFTELYRVNIKQRALSEGAYLHYSDKLKYNAEMGGLFTPQPSEFNTNIECITNPSEKVIGYIDVVKNVSVRELYISRKEITVPSISSEGCELTTLIEAKMPDYTMYMIGYVPVEFSPFGGTTWAKRKCADCRSLQATKNKPPFWPNEHK